MRVVTERQILRLTLVPMLLIAVAGCSRSPEAQAAKHLDAAKSMIQKRDYGRAILELRNAIKVTPKNAEAYYQLGVASSGSGDGRTAVSSYRKALDLDPHHRMAQLDLAKIMAVLGDKGLVEEAEDRLKKLLDNSSGNPDALNTLAFTELRLGRPEEAMEYLTRATARFPQELSSSLFLAQGKARSGDANGAEEALKKLTEGAPHSVEAWVW